MANIELSTDTPRITIEVSTNGDVSVVSDTPVRVLVMKHKDADTLPRGLSFEDKLMAVSKEPDSNHVDEAFVNEIWDRS